MTTTRIALAQINSTVGDFEGNTTRIISSIERGREAGADIIAVPELSLTGYPPEDLLLKPQFINANLKALDRVVSATSGIIGVFEANQQVRIMGLHGKPAQNLSECAWRKLRRSTSTIDKLCQSLCHSMLLGLFSRK